MLWDKNEYGKVYETVTSYYPYKKHIAKIISMFEVLANKSVLDVGCGTGYLLSELKNHDCQLEGIDISENLLQIAKKSLGNRAKFIQYDVSEGIPFNSDSFDYIVSNNVLGFLKNPNFFVAEVIRVLKSGGIFVISTMRPNFKPMRIYRDHLVHSKVVDIFKTFIPTVMVGYYNFKITKSIGKNEYAGYTGYDAESLSALFDKSLISNVCYEYSYANQNVIVKGKKN